LEHPLVLRLKAFQKEASLELERTEQTQGLQELKVRFLGKKGPITEIMKGLGKLDATERAAVGQVANQVKEQLQQALQQKLEKLETQSLSEALAKDNLDVTLPGLPPPHGSKHPITQTLAEVELVFLGLGFKSYQGPQIETDYYNFEALNIPANHPARDMQDTFYLENSKYLLRTHTSPVQIRAMEKDGVPIRMIAPGAVYRHDHDVTHTPMFHQLEGLWVDENVTFADLKGVLTLFVQRVFGDQTPVRFRPSFFPFTEPSAEMDIGCVLCEQQGCRVCKQSGWLEIMGCGMVDPAVFAHVGVDSERYTGFAFGMGIERIAMLKLGIPDIRLFFENDLRFLQQF